MKEIKNLSFSQESMFVKELLKAIENYKKEKNGQEVVVKASIIDEIEIRQNIAIRNEEDYHKLNIRFGEQVPQGTIWLI